MAAAAEPEETSTAYLDRVEEGVFAQPATAEEARAGEKARLGAWLVAVTALVCAEYAGTFVKGVAGAVQMADAVTMTAALFAAIGGDLEFRHSKGLHVVYNRARRACGVVDDAAYAALYAGRATNSRSVYFANGQMMYRFEGRITPVCAATLLGTYAGRNIRGYAPPANPGNVIPGAGPFVWAGLVYDARLPRNPATSVHVTPKMVAHAARRPGTRIFATSAFAVLLRDREFANPFVTLRTFCVHVNERGHVRYRTGAGERRVALAELVIRAVYTAAGRAWPPPLEFMYYCIDHLFHCLFDHTPLEALRVTAAGVAVWELPDRARLRAGEYTEIRGQLWPVTKRENCVNMIREARNGTAVSSRYAGVRKRANGNFQARVPARADKKSPVIGAFVDERVAALVRDACVRAHRHEEGTWRDIAFMPMNLPDASDVTEHAYLGIDETTRAGLGVFKASLPAVVTDAIASIADAPSRKSTNALIKMLRARVPAVQGHKRPRDDDGGDGGGLHAAKREFI